MRSVHGRSGTASSRVSTAAAAARRVRKGPSAPSRGVLTTDSRGKASVVGVIHQARCGRRDRRLYGGWWAAISRSSRTAASSGWAHTTVSTRSASAIMSRTRRRRSPEVK
jgi:hypothetical protein